MSEVRHRPFVPEHVAMGEFTLRAVLLGLVMTVVLGAANTYLGLRAGMTIAATYPAAVISMAVLRLRRGSILEENLARTAGSIGESVAAGAVFTLPAFILAGVWPRDFTVGDAYWKSVALMIVGSVLGVLFCSLIRRPMVEDRELQFPESVAAGEIHKAGQRGAQAARHLFWNMGLGALLFTLGKLQIFALEAKYLVRIGSLGRSAVKLGEGEGARQLATGGATTFSAPDISPAYFGVGYIIGPRVASWNFAGGVLAWGLLVPLLLYFLGPELAANLPVEDHQSWGGLASSVWRFIVRPIAVGGMLVGAAYTLFRMRKNLAAGLSRAVAESLGRAAPPADAGRTERYMSSRTVFLLIGLTFVPMLALYIQFAGSAVAGLTAAVVLLVAGFFFATVSGYLVGVIGSSNNPISGLTLSTLIVAALLMVTMGVEGTEGVLAVLGVAAVVCVAAAVAGELLQDFKVGWILGGTPRTIQIVELIAVVVASLTMFFPLMLLHQGNIKAGGTGFGDPSLSAPQAGLMAMLAQGIVGGDMPWALVGVGMLLGFTMILLQVRSPMLVSVGMYLPLGTTFAIFVGGMIRGVMDLLARRRALNEAQKTRAENVGVLAASGLIAGEALVGLLFAGYYFFVGAPPKVFEEPSYLAGLAVAGLIALVLVRVPLRNAGSPDEPAPPAAMM